MQQSAFAARLSSQHTARLEEQANEASRMRVHVWFGAGRLLIPLKGDETVSWLCGEAARRIARRLCKEARVEGLRLPTAPHTAALLDPALPVKSVVEDGGDFVAVFSGDPVPAQPLHPPPPQHSATAATDTAVCVQCGSTFNVAEEEECERLGRHPADPARLCRFHAQPPVKHLWCAVHVLLDKEFYQHALLVCERCTLDSNGCREVPVAQSEHTSVALLVTADTNSIAALRVAIGTKADKPASCVHFYCIGA